MAAHKATIKKYSDRRLYDAAARRYVNLDDVSRMIREGMEVEVVDARTGEDLTRIVLTQIIMEDVRDGESGLPLKLLHQLVVASDRAGHEMLSWYLDNAAELTKRAKTAVTAPMDFVKSLLGGAPPPDPYAAELESLRREIEDLKRQLKAEQKAQPGRARRLAKERKH